MSCQHSSDKTPAQLWVERLRSGDYKQARGALRENGAYCCLGVACDLYKEVVGKGEWYAQEDGRDDFVVYGDGGDGTLPPEVCEWLGLRHDDGAYSSETLSLAELNDQGSLFDEIADLIEDAPEGLFR